MERPARGTPRVKDLKARHGEIWDRGPFHAQPYGDLGLRTHRAIAWFERGAKEHADDEDVAFILYWIAFNAAYGKEMPRQDNGGDRDQFAVYLTRLIRSDTSNVTHSLLWGQLSEHVRNLLNNEYLFAPFWPNADWQGRFQRFTRRVNEAWDMRHTQEILAGLFDCLYMLRNQLVHGGAKWNSSFNRDSVRAGAVIMASLVPVFIEIMLDKPRANWGPAKYPPGLQDGNRSRRSNPSTRA